MARSTPDEILKRHRLDVRSLVRRRQSRARRKIILEAAGLKVSADGREMHCIICRRSFAVGRTDERYCSNACRQKAYRTRRKAT